MKPNPDPQAARIIASLEPLFEEAKAKGLWFWCAYQGLWFSPSDLRKQHANGSFIWGPPNWRLRDPAEMIAEAQRELDAAKARLERAKEHVLGGSAW